MFLLSSTWLTTSSLRGVTTLLFSFSCASVFPESPRWQLATSQIPQLKWSLKEFTIRNEVCLLYGVAMTDSLLSGTLTSARTHTHTPLGLKE